MTPPRPQLAPAPADAPAVLTVRDLVVGYNGRPLLPPIRFDVRPGQLWALVGRNGSGKTTLLRTLLGLLPRLGGAATLAPGASIGYVPQRTELDPLVPTRVVDLVRGGTDLGWSFLSPRAALARRAAVQRAMAETDCARFATCQVAELSEGQKQRVLLARALACEPALLILDEPTSAMDVASEAAVFDLLDQVRAQRDLAVLVVSHHLSLMTERATHALVVDRDDQVALAGPMAEVIRKSAFLERYDALCTHTSHTPHPQAAH